MVNTDIENDQIVQSLSEAVWSGEANLSTIPGLLKRVIKEGMWQRRMVLKTGEIVQFRRFAEFVASPPLEGLGTDIKTLQRLCADDKEALVLIDEAVQNRHGVNQHTEDLYNIQERAPSGTSQAATIRRLRKDRPDLLERVVAGDLSPNAAAREAGFRAHKVAVNMADPESAARTIRRFMDADAIQELIRLLQE
jgi:hypothetical protein